MNLELNCMNHIDGLCRMLSFGQLNSIVGTLKRLSIDPREDIQQISEEMSISFYFLQNKLLLKYPEIHKSVRYESQLQHNICLQLLLSLRVDIPGNSPIIRSLFNKLVSQLSYFDFMFKQYVQVKKTSNQARNRNIKYETSDSALKICLFRIFRNYKPKIDIEEYIPVLFRNLYTKVGNLGSWEFYIDLLELLILEARGFTVFRKIDVVLRNHDLQVIQSEIYFYCMKLGMELILCTQNQRNKANQQLHRFLEAIHHLRASSVSAYFDTQIDDFQSTYSDTYVEQF